MKTNFILSKGPLIKQYKRALKSAERHEQPIVLWYGDDKPDVSGLDVETKKLEIPAWLQSAPPAAIFDWLGYDLGYKYGGLYLGLDTHTVASATDLLGDKEIVVSRDVPDDEHHCIHPYNNHIICQPGSEVMFKIRAACKRRILSGFLSHGDTAPALLTDFVRRYPDKIVGAPFPALCGWEGSYIWKFYLGVEPPPPGTRVIHLFASAYRELFYDDDIDSWVRMNPFFGQWAQGPKVDPAIFQ